MLQVEKKYLEKLSEAVYRLLKGKSADPVELPQDYPDNELKQVVGYINKFICDYGVFNVSMDFIAKGVLDFAPRAARPR